MATFALLLLCYDHPDRARHLGGLRHDWNIRRAPQLYLLEPRPWILGAKKNSTGTVD